MRTSRSLLLILLLVCPLAGCVNSGLPSERDIPELDALRNIIPDQEMRLHRVATTLPNAPPLALAVHDIGQPDAQRIVVLLHGCLSDHRCWRFVWGTLAEDMRVVLVDLPGCGASDKPSPRSLGPLGYSPDAMAERVAQALELHLLMEDTQPTPITIVGHSLGGTIGLRMLSSPGIRHSHERLLRRVDRLVLFAPADLDMPNPPALFMQVANVSGSQIAVADLLGVLQRRIDDGTRDSYADRERAVREEADRLYRILRRSETRIAAQATLLQALPRRNGRPDWPAIERLHREYDGIDVPCLIVWGAQDETLPAAAGFRLASGMPQATLVVLPDCMHSVHLEQPATCVAFIREFSADPIAFTDRATAVLLALTTPSSPVAVYRHARSPDARPAAAVE